MRKAVKNSDTVTVQGWMVNELELKGNSLLIYAIIYKAGDYSGGYRYLAEFTGSHINTAIRITKELVAAGYLTKEVEEIGGNIIPHFKAVRRG